MSKNWANQLLPYCKSPQSHSTTVFYDKDFVIIKDSFPKSKLHFLIMPRREAELHQLTALDIPLIQKLSDLANFLIDGTLEMTSNDKFDIKKDDMLIGFHAVPSQKQLHLHVLSNDLSLVKNKKHYNSFATNFFQKPEKYISQLESDGRVKVFYQP
jgi:aprataxin